MASFYDEKMTFFPKYTWSSSEFRRISIHNDKIPVFSSQDWKPFHHTACLWTGTTFYRKRWQFIYRVTLTHPTPKSTSTWRECTATYRSELDDGISYLTWAKVSNIYCLVSICWAQSSLPQDMPQRHIDYFVLKLLEKQQMQEEHSDFPFFFF